MLIRDAELADGRQVDVRVDRGRIAAIGRIEAQPGEPELAAGGGLLLPGLHDHHIHLAAYAAALTSVRCGPPEVIDADGLARALDRPGSDWLRGTGYHESVAGLLDRRMLDALVPDRPVRIQHRGGRMWFLNSSAIDALRALAPAPPGLDRATGRLFEGDSWLRATLAACPPDLADIGARLARTGVTGVTDMSPANDGVIARHVATERAHGALPQRVMLAGAPSLGPADMGQGMTLGPAKLHLHEAALPALDTVVSFARAAHAIGRPIAVHCVTEVELLYALAMVDEAGAIAGDRIEHASVTPDFAIGRIAEHGLAVCTQPHFIAERGDAYIRDVEAGSLPLLYRLRSFLAAGIALAGGSDAPFGGGDPWAAMAAAVSRAAQDGTVIGPDEALSPEQALDLYLCDPARLDRRRTVAAGMPADLCLLDRPWAAARQALSSTLVRAVFVDGRRIDDGVDQPPGERGPRTDPPA